MATTAPTTTTRSTPASTASAIRAPERQLDEDPPTYHSGRVRIIGAEPAGDTVREVTGPVGRRAPRAAALERRADRPGARRARPQHRRRAVVAPPDLARGGHDWEAQEEIFEPSMLADDLPASGRCSASSATRSTWSASPGTSIRRHAGDPARAGLEPGPARRAGVPARDRCGRASSRAPLDEPPVRARATSRSEAAPRVGRRSTAGGLGRGGRRGSIPPASPPRAQGPRRRARTPRRRPRRARGNVSTAGTGGRDLRVAIGIGRAARRRWRWSASPPARWRRWSW